MTTEATKDKAKKKIDHPAPAKTKNTPGLVSLLISKAISALTIPFQWVKNKIENIWLRCEPWVVRNKWRLLWSTLALIFLTVFVGGLVTLWIWREEIVLAAHWTYGQIVGSSQPVAEVVVAQATTVEKVAQAVSPNGSSATS